MVAEVTYLTGGGPTVHLAPARSGGRCCGSLHRCGRPAAGYRVPNPCSPTDRVAGQWKAVTGGEVVSRPSEGAVGIALRELAPQLLQEGNPGVLVGNSNVAFTDQVDDPGSRAGAVARSPGPAPSGARQIAAVSQPSTLWLRADDRVRCSKAGRLFAYVYI